VVKLIRILNKTRFCIYFIFLYK